MNAIKSKLITSPTNHRIKSLVKLRHRRYRDQTGLIVIDGIREFKLAQNFKISFKEIYYCRDFLREIKLLDEIDKGSVNLFEVSVPVFSKIAFGERKEGIVVVAKQPKKKLEDLAVNKESIFVVVEGVEKPGNLGAIIRTCDGLGIGGLISCDGKTDVYNPNCIRASLGACFSLPVVEAKTKDVITWLKKRNITIISAVVDSQISIWEAKFTFPCALVLGTEAQGLSTLLKASSDIEVSIPMKGAVDSLNVSSSAAIIIYEALRQIRTKGA